MRDHLDPIFFWFLATITLGTFLGCSSPCRNTGFIAELEQTFHSESIRGINDPLPGYFSPPISVATIIGDCRAIQWLMTRGADLHTPDTEGLLPLTIAAVYDYPPIIQMLIEHGADPYITNKNPGKTTALSEAVSINRARIVELLLKLGVNPNHPSHASEDGWTPLMYAIRMNYNKVARLLLDHGADPNAQTAVGMTALLYAAISGNAKGAHMLLAHGAQMDLAPPSPGTEWTPLHWAASGGSLKLTRLLLNYGADPQARDAQGKTAADIAIEREYIAIANLIQIGQNERPER